MIDYIKLDISYLDWSELTALVQLEAKAKGVITILTGEMGPTETARYGGLTFTKTRHNIFLSGSIHKYHNYINGFQSQNFSDFSYSDLTACIQHLSVDYGLIPEKSKIVNLEFGVNINLEMCPSDLIMNHIVSYDWIKTHSVASKYGKKARFLQFNQSQFCIKVYDKGKQYGLEQNLLRIEQKTNRAKFTSNMNIVTLADLLCPIKLTSLKQELLKRYDKLLILDRYEQRAEPRIWREEFINNPRTTVKRHQKKFKEAMESDSNLNLKKSIRAAVETKWNALLSSG